ncbi:MAG: hypothetical protein Q9208_003365 [Pyrenodesmia sp. 3 TL-2023]
MHPHYTKKKADYSIDGRDAGHQADLHDRDPQLMGRSGTSPVNQELDADEYVTLQQLPPTRWEVMQRCGAGTKAVSNYF